MVRSQVNHKGEVLDGHHRVEAYMRDGKHTMKVGQIPSILIKTKVNSEQPSQGDYN